MKLRIYTWYGVVNDFDIQLLIIVTHLTTLLLCFSIALLTCRYRDVVSVSSGLHNLQVTIGRPSWWNHTMRHIIKSHTMKFLVLSRCFLTAWPYEIKNIHLISRRQCFACSIPDNCDAFDYTFIMFFNCSAITCPYRCAFIKRKCIYTA